VKNVGKPCAGDPHARFDGRGLETCQMGNAPVPDPTISRIYESTFVVVALGEGLVLSSPG